VKKRRTNCVWGRAPSGYIRRRQNLLGRESILSRRIDIRGTENWIIWEGKGVIGDERGAMERIAEGQKHFPIAARRRILIWRCGKELGGWQFQPGKLG